MDKEYMLVAIRRRIAFLEKAYTAACNNKTIDGRELTSNGAGSKRAKLKKDIQLLLLIRALLMEYTGGIIEDEDACEAFDKLVEPRSCSGYLESKSIYED